LEESQRYAQLLGYNYLSSEWYKKSYKIFNKDYSIMKRKRVKKKKRGVIKKFKRLFD
jgi:outer membrane protein assembly factor BamD